MTMMDTVPMLLALTVMSSEFTSKKTVSVSTEAMLVFEDDRLIFPAELEAVIEKDADSPGCKVIFCVDTLNPPTAKALSGANTATIRIVASPRSIFFISYLP